MLHAKKELLLHVCCAPCATAVIEALASEFRLTAFFYNPNIQPSSEYHRRLEQVDLLCRRKALPLVISDYDDAYWAERTSGLAHEPEGGGRCRICFDIRLARTGQAALERNIGFISTTLSISPHKSTAAINQAGAEAARRAGIAFLERDYKENDGYRTSCKLSKTYGLYRQKYCGCLYSLPKKGTDEKRH